jgi:hypothetical protein
MLDDIDEDINAGIIPKYALSLYAPWVWAILHAGKDIENRSWKPHPDLIGQWIWLHVSLGNGPTQMRDELRRMTEVLQPDRRPPQLDELMRMRGLIVGRVKLLEVVEESESPWFFGPYGWKLDARGAYLIDPGVPAKGLQRYWKVPHATLRKLAVISAGTSFG